MASHPNQPRAVFLNDWLKSEPRYRAIQSIIAHTDAVVLVMVRGNVIGRAMSAEKLWGQNTPQTIQLAVKTAVRTTTAYITAFTRLRSQRRSATDIVFHEELAYKCGATITRIASITGIPFTSSLCQSYTPPPQTRLLDVPAWTKSITRMKIDDIVCDWMNRTDTTVTFGHW